MDGPHAIWVKLLGFVWGELSRAAATMRGNGKKKGGSEGRAAGEAAADLVPALSRLLWINGGVAGGEQEGVLAAFAEAFDVAPSASRFKKAGVAFIQEQVRPLRSRNL